MCPPHSNHHVITSIPNPPTPYPTPLPPQAQQTDMGEEIRVLQTAMQKDAAEAAQAAAAAAQA